MSTAFCIECGAVQAPNAPVDERRLVSSPGTRQGVEFALGLVAVGGLSAAIGYFGWEQLARPTQELGDFVLERASINPRHTDVSSCDVGGSLASIGCTARAAGYSLIGVLLVAVALFAFRSPLVRLLKTVIARLPSPIRPVLGAVLAATIFAMTYANIHPNPELATAGLLPVKLFAMVIGVVTFVVAALSTSAARFGEVVFSFRDRIPTLARIVLVLVIPLLTGRLMLEQVGDLSNMVQEQVVILASTLIATLAFIPNASTPNGAK